MAITKKDLVTGSGKYVVQVLSDDGFPDETHQLVYHVVGWLVLEDSNEPLQPRLLPMMLVPETHEAMTLVEFLRRNPNVGMQNIHVRPAVKSVSGDWI